MKRRISKILRRIAADFGNFSVPKTFRLKLKPKLDRQPSVRFFPASSELWNDFPGQDDE